MANQKIEQKLALLPDKPGVYLMRNAAGKIIYVGKALVLKNRVRSYFRGTPADRKTARLVNKIADLEYIITATESEALVLEANLIKKHKPRYNVMLKDDKRYPFIKITLNEPFPRLAITRQLERDGARYFGPYADAKIARLTIQTLQWLFPLRNCTKDITGPIPGARPCMLYQIGKCSAPCAGKISQEAYLKNVRNIIRYLSGQSKQLIDVLKQEMQTLSEDLKFEQAAKVRDKILMLQKARDRQTMYFTDGLDRDILGIYKDGTTAAVAVLKIIGGKLLSREIHDLQNVEDDSSEQELLDSFLAQYYAPRLDNLPNELLLPFELPENSELHSLLPIKLSVPKRGDNSRLTMTARENAFNQVETQKLAHIRKSTRSVFAVQELKDKLGLNRLPRKIACFDISTIQGTDTVASAVFFENGKPKKSNYRKFIIKTVQGQDDFASLREALTRYIAHVNSGDFDKPDLFVIDGGKGQLSAAYGIFTASGIEEAEMVSLAKRLEEVYLPGRSDPIVLSASSSALRLITALRDESHRFAITFHRKRRQGRTLVSALDPISGLGEETRFLLLNHFGSVTKIKQAMPSELMQVKGVGKVMAKRILEHLNADTANTDDSGTEQGNG